jgi:Uma2 family endonuclease
MAVVGANVRDVIEHLPPGAALRIDDVSWDEYERLLDDLGEGYGARITFDCGRLEIVMPSPAHEKAKSILHTMVAVLRDELDIDVESLGSTTLREPLKQRGVEPDDCFYVRRAAQVIGREDLDLVRDSPPDIAVEVERTSASLDKLVIYAALGVPEVWRVRRAAVHILHLVGARYEEAPSSLSFSFVTADALSTHLARGLAEGTRAATRAFRAWVQERRGPAV